MVVRNTVANGFGTIVIALMQMLVQVGAYRLTGPDEYGLISFFNVLLTVASLFDVGLASVVTRETARLHAGIGSSGNGGLGTMLFTLQMIYLGISVIFISVIILSAPLISGTWLHAKAISGSERTFAIILMAFAAGLQRPRLAYSSFLEGLQRQVTTNILYASLAVSRAALGLGSLLLVAPTATVFLYSQILASILESSLFAFIAWSNVEPHPGAGYRFSGKVLHELLGFIATNSGALLLGMLLLIGDKIILSGILPIAAFGRYNLISMVCLTILRLTTPFGTAYFPRMSAQAAHNDHLGLIRSYFTLSQFYATTLAPVLFALIFFRKEVLEIILSGDRTGINALASVLIILAIANVISGLSRSCHALQLSEGNPRTALHINIVMVIIYIPGVFLLTPIYGMTAPAFLWLGVNSLSFVVYYFTAHRHTLAGYAWAWVEKCALPQFAISAVILLVARAVAPASAPLYTIVAVAFLSTIIAMVGAGLASSYLRPAIVAVLVRGLRPSRARSE